MSGLLDNKSRVLDTVLTQLGHSQLASGKLKVCYVSFTDSTTFYKGDIASGTQDPSSRAYLEASSLPQDQITFSADDSGKLLPFGNTADIQIKAGQFIDHAFIPVTGSMLTGSSDTTLFMNSDTFASLSDDLLVSSVDNFNNLQMIGTFDKLFDDDGFDIGNKNVTFTFTDTSPLVDRGAFTANLNNLDSMFNDTRFSHLPNFRFLPPLNKTSDPTIDKTDYTTTSKYALGNYKPLGRASTTSLSAEQLDAEFAYYEKYGCVSKVIFEPTSNNNKLMAQFFEVTNDTMKKLDVIDYGWVSSTNTRKRYFFVGKVMTDDNNTHTFIHLFSLVFG